MDGVSNDPREQRPTFKVIIERPAGPSNRYRLDTSTGRIALAGVGPDAATAGLEFGYVSRTRTDTGSPLRAAVAVRLPTFEGCLIPVHLLGMLRPADGRPPLLLAVPAVDPELAPLQTIEDLSEAAVREARAGRPNDAVAGAHEAAAIVRTAIEAERRFRAVSARSEIPAWKVSDELPPADGRGGEAQSHTYAEHAVRRLPARFQEYIARALLPEERILTFVTRPALPRRGLPGLHRAGLREGILVITDRQVMLMTDSSDAGNAFVHWGYIARTSAIERVRNTEVRRGPRAATLDVTFAAAHGAERCSFDVPLDRAPALDEAAALLRRFLPEDGSRSLRRQYERALPQALPSLAAAIAPREAPSWAQASLPDEPLLAWADTAAARGEPARVAVGTHHVVLHGTREQRDHPAHVRVDDITSLEMVLSLLSSRLEIATADGEAVRRLTLTFDYPAGPGFLTAFTAIRHLLGLPPATPPPCRGANR